MNLFEGNAAAGEVVAIACIGIDIVGDGVAIIICNDILRLIHAGNPKHAFLHINDKNDTVTVIKCFFKTGLRQSIGGGIIM